MIYMKIALAAVGFMTNNTAYNLAKIKGLAEQCSDKVDLILLGESFLQGFECLSWDYSKDVNIAVDQNSDLIDEIRAFSKTYQVALSFGYIEKAKDKIYSSQLTLDKKGKTLNDFRRVSTGWKEAIAGSNYVEGEGFSQFEYLGKTISVALCGDLWYEDNCAHMKQLNSDLVLWSVYTDFNYQEWNTKLKYECAEQAGKCGENVLYVNSYCVDGGGYEIARGGAALFVDGRIKAEKPSGEENVLVVEI